MYTNMRAYIHTHICTFLGVFFMLFSLLFTVRRTPSPLWLQTITFYHVHLSNRNNTNNFSARKCTVIRIYFFTLTELPSVEKIKHIYRCIHYSIFLLTLNYKTTTRRRNEIPLCACSSRQWRRTVMNWIPNGWTNA